VNAWVTSSYRKNCCVWCEAEINGFRLFKSKSNLELHFKIQIRKRITTTLFKM